MIQNENRPDLKSGTVVFAGSLASILAVVACSVVFNDSSSEEKTRTREKNVVQPPVAIIEDDSDNFNSGESVLDLDVQENGLEKPYSGPPIKFNF